MAIQQSLFQVITKKNSDKKPKLEINSLLWNKFKRDNSRVTDSLSSRILLILMAYIDRSSSFVALSYINNINMETDLISLISRFKVNHQKIITIFLKINHMVNNMAKCHTRVQYIPGLCHNT
ncbi:hypothetical protein BLOT_016859 [Blomia tropicalis]|nr:hypothetical protein BLOT_016859 [Blomia tropicalis]